MAIWVSILDNKVLDLVVRPKGQRIGLETRWPKSWFAFIFKGRPIDNKFEPEASIPPEAMMHSPCFRFFPILKKFRFSSAKNPYDLFLVIDHRFWMSPYFACFSTFPPWLANIIISPYFHKFPPLFSENSLAFYILCVYFPSAFTMMHLCITQCTHWTPLVWASLD